MGLFDALKSTAKAAANIAAVPVDAALDVVTLGGLNTDRKESHVESRVKRIAKHAKDAIDSSYED